MILKTFLTQEPAVSCSTILFLISRTGWYTSAQGACFVTLVCKVVQCVTRIAYVPLCHCSSQVCNIILVFRVQIIRVTISCWKQNFHETKTYQG